MARSFACDIVFLIDATGSMQPAIDAIRNNIGRFFQDFFREYHQLYGRDADWRARVVGYRDVEEDGDDGYVANPFVRDVESVEAQLDALRAIGGGLGVLPSALYKVVTGGTPPRGSREDDPGMWRHRRDAVRFVIVFTAAVTKLPEDSGFSHEDIVNIVMQERFWLFIVAPRMDCNGKLATIDRCTYIPVSANPSLPHAESSGSMGNPDVFRELACQIPRMIWRTRFYVPDAETL